MSSPVLATKLYFPPARPKVVLRTALLQRLNDGLHRKLTLVSAPAGFGKTTLVSEWLSNCEQHVSWLSLDEADSDPTRFLRYLVAAVQSFSTQIGQGVLLALESPQPPSVETILTSLVNDLATLSEASILVLDDYHLIDGAGVDEALQFLLEHLPPQFHLVIVTREDPALPLARLRARAQLTELRVSDLRFSNEEVLEFLTQVMGLQLSAEHIEALEARTEGWIAGLQLAALSMQGQADTSHFIESFTGSHHFVLDYLLEEVLQQQPQDIQAFLLRTSILGRFCASLCDSLLGSETSEETLKLIEQANLFIIPLDNERRWYRYHHLFADLLRQRLTTNLSEEELESLHTNASQWFEANGLELEAFHHGTLSRDVQSCIRIIEGNGFPLQFRGGVMPILTWLESLAERVCDEHPVLWVTKASCILMLGKIKGIEPILKKAEAALEERLSSTEPNEPIRDLVGRIASIRSTVAVTQQDLAAVIKQSQRALDYLHPKNLPVRTSINWTLGYAYSIQGERAEAEQAYQKAIESSEAIGHPIINMIAKIGLGQLQESNLQFSVAKQTFESVLAIFGDASPPPVCEVFFGLSRMAYEHNDLAKAHAYLEKSMVLAKQIENTDRFVDTQIFLAKLYYTQGKTSKALSLLDEAETSAKQQNFFMQLPNIAVVRINHHLETNNLDKASTITDSHDLPLSKARVLIAQNQSLEALKLIQAILEKAQDKNWIDKQLECFILAALAHQANQNYEEALSNLKKALDLAQPNVMIRSFLNEGSAMNQLLSKAFEENIQIGYCQQLLQAFSKPKQETAKLLQEGLIEPLSAKELEVLKLVAKGLSNQAISKKLYRALSTIKGHNRIIFDKLQVQNRTEAVAKARALGLL